MVSVASSVLELDLVEDNINENTKDNDQMEEGNDGRDTGERKDDKDIEDILKMVEAMDEEEDDYLKHILEETTKKEEPINSPEPGGNSPLAPDLNIDIEKVQETKNKKTPNKTNEQDVSLLRKRNNYEGNQHKIAKSPLALHHSSINDDSKKEPPKPKRPTLRYYLRRGSMSPRITHGQDANAMQKASAGLRRNSSPTPFVTNNKKSMYKMAASPHFAGMMTPSSYITKDNSAFENESVYTPGSIFERESVFRLDQSLMDEFPDDLEDDQEDYMSDMEDRIGDWEHAEKNEQPQKIDSARSTTSYGMGNYVFNKPTQSIDWEDVLGLDTIAIRQGTDDIAKIQAIKHIPYLCSIAVPNPESDIGHLLSLFQTLLEIRNQDYLFERERRIDISNRVKEHMERQEKINRGEDVSDHGTIAHIAEDMISAFRKFDIDNDGFITREELKKTMISMGNMLTEEELDGLMARGDTDGDNQINYREFVRLMTDDDDHDSTVTHQEAEQLLKEELTKVRNELKQQILENANLEVKCSKLERNKETQDDQLANAIEEKYKAVNDLKLKEEQVDALSLKLESVEDENLTEKLKQIELQLDESKQNWKTKENTYQNMIKRLEKHISSFEEKTGQKIVEDNTLKLESHVSELSENLKIKTDELERTKEQHQQQSYRIALELEETKRDLLLKERQLNEEMQRNQELLANTDITYLQKELSNTISKYEKRVKHKQQELEAIHIEHEKLEVEYSKSLDKINQLKEKLKEMSGPYNKAVLLEEEVAQLQDALQSSTKEQERLNNLLSNDEKVKKYKNLAETYKHRYSTYKQESQRAKQQVQNELKGTTQQLNDSQKKSRELQKQLDKFQTNQQLENQLAGKMEVERVNHQNSIYKSRIDELKLQLEECQHEKQVSIEEIKALKMRMDELTEHQPTSQPESVQKLKVKLHKLRAKHRASVVETEKEQSLLKKETKKIFEIRFRGKIKKLNRELKESKAAKKELERTLAHLKTPGRHTPSRRRGSSPAITSRPKSARLNRSLPKSSNFITGTKEMNRPLSARVSMKRVESPTSMEKSYSIKSARLGRYL